MNTKSRFSTFFDSNRLPAEYIAMYEENISYFNELLKNGRKEDLEYALSIKIYKYADSLYKMGCFGKALKVQTEIEKDLLKIKGQSTNYAMFEEATTFLKAICLSNLKKYKNANLLLRKLIRKSPTNDNFKNWYKSNQKHQICNVFSLISVIGFSSYLIIIALDFTDHPIKNLIVRILGLSIGLISVALSFILAKVIDRKTINL